jgi:hypothetical protein
VAAPVAPVAVMSSATRRGGEGPKGFDRFFILLHVLYVKLSVMVEFLVFFWTTL